MLNAGLVESKRKKEMRGGREVEREYVHVCVPVCVRACVLVCTCICVRLNQWGEGTLTFVSIVKAPQVSCAHIVSFIEEGPTYALSLSGGVREFTACI